jgi:hypothetical protein
MIQKQSRSVSSTKMSNLLETVTLIDLVQLTYALDLLQLNARTNGFMMTRYRKLIVVVMILLFRAPVAVRYDGSGTGAGRMASRTRPTVVVPRVQRRNGQPRRTFGFYRSGLQGFVYGWCELSDRRRCQSG